MNDLHVTIVTGASRGLGHAIAVQRLSEGHRVLTLQRHPSPALAPDPRPGSLEQWACDLADPLPVAARLRAWLEALPPDGRIASLALVNNAALLADPGPLAEADPAQTAAAVRVGLEAPLVLTQAFLAGSAHLAAHAGRTVPRKVLQISSGLGRFAMAGSAVYCAVKAGLDHASRALALEEAARPHGAKVVSLAPGVIDTDMQVQLRSADAQVFPERRRFAALHEQGSLTSPQAAAAKVLACLDRADFGTQPVADVRDAA